MQRSTRTAALVTRLTLQDTKATLKGNKSDAKRGGSKGMLKKATMSKFKSASKDVEAEKPNSLGSKRNKKQKTTSASVSKKSKIESPAEVEELSPYFSQQPSSMTLMTSTVTKLTREFYTQDCVRLCKALLGTVLVRRLPRTGEIVRGTIVETEAYGGYDDRASQSFQGKRTPRNEAMFLDPGTAYVYFTYGMYFCFNISSNGEGSACLLRAVEPLKDYEIMHSLRIHQRKTKNDVDHNLKSTKSEAKAKGRKEAVKRLKSFQLANGPSKLCMAFDIRRDTCDKIDMTTSDELWIELSEEDKFRNREFEIDITKRIGIDSAPPESRDRLLRFLIRDNLAVSKAKVSEIKKRLGI